LKKELVLKILWILKERIFSLKNTFYQQSKKIINGVILHQNSKKVKIIGYK